MYLLGGLTESYLLRYMLSSSKILPSGLKEFDLLNRTKYFAFKKDYVSDNFAHRYTNI